MRKRNGDALVHLERWLDRERVIIRSRRSLSLEGAVVISDCAYIGQ